MPTPFACGLCWFFGPHVEPLCYVYFFFQGMLGIFFSAKSAVLIEDVPFTKEDMHNEWVWSACETTQISWWRIKCLTVLSVPQYETSREDLRAIQPGGHQLLHCGRHLRGSGRRVAVPGAAQQTAGVHGDIRSCGRDLWPLRTGHQQLGGVLSSSEDQSTANCCEPQCQGVVFGSGVRPELFIFLKF